MPSTQYPNSDPPQAVATPWALYFELQSRYATNGHFDLDPCCGPDTAKAPKYYALEHGNDGLVLPWKGSVFVNPPYDNIEAWICKALLELREGRITCAVFLVPPRTEQAWWQLVQGQASEVVYIEGRVQFVYAPEVEAQAKAQGKHKSNTAPSVAIVFRPPLRAKDFQACQEERQDRGTFGRLVRGEVFRT